MRVKPGSSVVHKRIRTQNSAHFANFRAIEVLKLMKNEMLYPGQPCRKCGTPVVKKVTKSKPAIGQRYGFRWSLFCNNCHTLYLVEEARYEIDPDDETIEWRKIREGPKWCPRCGRKKNRKAKMCAFCDRRKNVMDNGDLQPRPCGAEWCPLGPNPKGKLSTVCIKCQQERKQLKSRSTIDVPLQKYDDDECNEMEQHLRAIQYER